MKKRNWIIPIIALSSVFWSCSTDTPPAPAENPSQSSAAENSVPADEEKSDTGKGVALISIETKNKADNVMDFVEKPVAPHVAADIATWTPNYEMPPAPYYEDCLVTVKDKNDNITIENADAKVKVRGNWTTTYDKKPLRIKFVEKRNMLGLNDGAEMKNWVLLAEYKDGSMLRDKAALEIARGLLEEDGLYASDAEFAEVEINGEYWGMYLLAELQQINPNRVNITEPATVDYAGTDIGYFLEFDGYFDDESELQMFHVDYADNAPLVPYDGNGGSFGDMLVPTVTDDVSLASSYAAINGTDKGTVTAMVTNKDLENAENAVISLNNSDTSYEAAAVYAVYGDSTDIRLIDIVENVEDNKVNVTLPAYSAAMVVITDDASDFDSLEIYNPDKYEQKTESFDNPSEMINADGHIEIPITDPEHLVRIDITANVKSSAGSTWGSAGCAVCLNAVDKEGTGFWTSKAYSLKLGNGSTASVEFDGTLSNKDEIVEAVISDGKVELQHWWDASEKMEADIEDIISIEYTKVDVIYEYENTASEIVSGDVNGNGEVDVADAIAIMSHVTNAEKFPLTDAQIKAGDVYQQGDGIAVTDAVSIQKYLTKLISELPES